MNRFRDLLVVVCILLTFGSSFGQLSPESSSGERAIAGNTIDLTRPKGMAKTDTQPVGFSETAKAAKIPHRTFTDLEHVSAGYYIIAGVFEGKKNAKRFTRKQQKQDFDAGYLVNPESGLHYAYLQRLDRWQDAIAAVQQKLDGRYQETTWVLEVKNSRAEPEAVAAPKEPVKMKKAGIFRKGGIKNPSLSKTLEKANLYYDRMWYAEAAELYDNALTAGGAYPYEVLQRAGDAHYFNTNMERALFWYEQLYDQYKQEMGSETLFKYAHSLKGTGKYGRAKRLMRLYNRQLKAEADEAASKGRSRTAREALLDDLLSAEEEFYVKNLQINSKYSDFSPMFHNDNELVFASSVDSSFFTTRRYKWNNQPYLDLYVAKMNEESQEVRDAVKFSKAVNTKYHEASVTFSPDQKTMYFTRNNYGKKLKRDKNGVNHLKIYRSVKQNGQWSEAVELPFNSDAYSTGHPALSPDGSKLYFVSDMPGSIGGTDIFVVDVLGDGEYSAPRNLGPTINTERKEMFPFVSGEKLYFSSDGHIGLGGLDIYVSEMTEDGVFGEARNMGQPINSKRDDFSYIIDEDTQKGYFSSNRPGGKGDDDIYAFRRLIPEEVNENAIAGIVTEVVSGDVIPKAMITLLDEQNRKLKEITAGDDGSFVFEDLESNQKYKLQVNGEGFMPLEQAVATRDNERIDIAANLKRIEELIEVENDIRKIKTEMIYFDFDKHYIRTDAAEELDKLVGIMKEYPSMVIKIESHTDSRGPAVYNKYLSDQRAKATRAYLIAQGIAPRRIESAIGYGEERLLNECDGSVRCSSQQHQRNRRSEFIIVNM